MTTTQLSPVQQLTEQFLYDINEHIASRIAAHIREAAATFQLGPPNLQPPPPRQLVQYKAIAGWNSADGVTTLRTQKPRKKAPIQLCPVPRCKERAAPAFGMVCAKHKDLPKMKIRKYREARRAKKAA